MTDTRIAYGARCTWWDSIAKVGNRQGLPCCPKCGNMLFETPDEKTWFEGVDAFEAKGEEGYRAFVEWGRGRCYPSYPQALGAYLAEETSR